MGPLLPLEEPAHTTGQWDMARLAARGRRSTSWFTAPRDGGRGRGPGEPERPPGAVDDRRGAARSVGGQPLIQPAPTEEWPRASDPAARTWRLRGQVQGQGQAPEVQRVAESRGDDARSTCSDDRSNEPDLAKWQREPLGGGLHRGTADCGDCARPPRGEVLSAASSSSRRRRDAGRHRRTRGCRSARRAAWEVGVAAFKKPAVRHRLCRTPSWRLGRRWYPGIAATPVGPRIGPPARRRRRLLRGRRIRAGLGSRCYHERLAYEPQRDLRPCTVTPPGQQRYRH